MLVLAMILIHLFLVNVEYSKKGEVNFTPKLCSNDSEYLIKLRTKTQAKFTSKRLLKIFKSSKLMLYKHACAYNDLNLSISY